MQAATTVLIVLIAYKLLLIGVGIWAKQRVSTQADFLLAGRGLGPFVAALSYSASNSSAWTLLGVTGAAFAMGLSAIWFAIGSVAGMLASWFLVAPRLMKLSRERDCLTVTDVFVIDMDGKWRGAVTVLASVIILSAFSFYIAAQFQGAGQTFNQIFGLGLNESIIFGGLVIMVYTFLGGFWAVSITDAVQGALMAAAALVLPIIAFVAVGGFSGFSEGLAANYDADQLSLTGGNSQLVALGFVLGILGVALGSIGQPHLLVRFMAIKDEKSLISARWLTIGWFMVVFGGMCFLGLAGRILMPDISNPETVFFALTELLLPTIIGAVVIAALLSAIMSTADSQLLAGAAAISRDLGADRFFPTGSVLVTRLAIAFLVVLAILVALNLPATIFDRTLLAWSALGAAFGPVIVCRALSRKLNPAAVFWAMLVGFIFTALFHFNPGQLIQTYLLGSVPQAIYERILPFVLAISILLAVPPKTPSSR